MSEHLPADVYELHVCCLKSRLCTDDHFHERDVARMIDAAVRDLAAKVEAVLATWQRELADYPDTEGGRAARAAVRIAAGEIRDVLADALPQEDV